MLIINPFPNILNISIPYNVWSSETLTEFPTCPISLEEVVPFWILRALPFWCVIERGWIESGAGTVLRVWSQNRARFTSPLFLLPVVSLFLILPSLNFPSSSIAILQLFLLPWWNRRSHTAHNWLNLGNSKKNRGLSNFCVGLPIAWWIWPFLATP